VAIRFVLSNSNISTKSVLDSMNFKGIFVVGVIAAIIIVVVLVPNNIKNTPPALDDKPSLNDSVLINSKLQSGDEIKLEDSTITDKPAELDYYLDENGTKHYIIKAKDEVNLSD